MLLTRRSYLQTDPNKLNEPNIPMTWKNTLAVTIIMLLTFGALHYFSRAENVVPNKPFSTFPTQIGEWKGEEDHFDSQVYQVLGVDDSFYANYHNNDGNWINFYVGFYQSQSEGELIHSPKNCMPGGGWNIIASQVVPIKIEGNSSVQINIIKLVLKKGASKQISYYWYQSRGRIISSEYMQKIYLVWDSITRNRTDGSFVRLIAPVISAEQDTEAILENFIQDVYPILRQYIPS